MPTELPIPPDELVVRDVVPVVKGERDG